MSLPMRLASESRKRAWLSLKVALVAFTLLAMGCADPNTLTVTFTADEVAHAPIVTLSGDVSDADVARACAIWAVTGVKCDEGGIPVQVIADTSPCTASLEWLGHGKDGVIRLHTSCTALRDDNTRVSVLAHELGHVLGLAHVDDPSALMYWRQQWPAPTCLTDADALEYRRAQGIQ